MEGTYIQHKLAGLLVVTIGALGIFLSAFYTYRSFVGRAAPAPLASVHINPENIVSPLGGKNVNLSALAYDSYGNPIWSGVSYQWGISTTNTIGYLFPNTDDKLATFEPSRTTSGTADLWVTAFGLGTQVTHSIPVLVGVTPTPTPPVPSATPTPTKEPTPSPTPTPIQRSIHLLEPNGGETIQRGSVYPITWDSTKNFNTISLSYSTNPLTYMYPIASNIPDTEVYSWTVFVDPSITNSHFRVFVTGTFGPNNEYSMSDFSDNYFTIPLPTPTPINTPTPTPIPTPTPPPTPIPTATPTSTPIACNRADINKDGIVNLADITLLLSVYWQSPPAVVRADINTDGFVDITDYSILVANYNTQTGACQ